MADRNLQRITIDVKDPQFPEAWKAEYDVSRFSALTLQAWDGLDFRLGFKGPGKEAMLEAMNFERDLLFISDNQDHIELAQSLCIPVIGDTSCGDLITPYKSNHVFELSADELEEIFCTCRGL